MERKYWEYQVDIIDNLELYGGEISYLKNTEESMVVVTPLFDKNVTNVLNKICEQAGLCYVYKPHTIHKRRNKQVPGVLFKFYPKE